MKKIRRKKADDIDLDERDKAIINILKKEERKTKLYKVISGVIIVCTLLLFICGIGWIKNLSYAYKFNGESENFSYNNMIFIKDHNVYYLVYGNNNIKNSNIKLEDITSVTLKCNDKLIVSSSDFLQGMQSENKGYDEYFPKEVVKNLDKWRLEITYNINNKEFTDIVELEKSRL